MDPLSDVLRVVRLTGGVFFRACIRAPNWSFRSPPAHDLARYLDVSDTCIALFHILVDGACTIELDGKGAVEVEPGTMIVLPHAQSHVLGSARGLEPVPLDRLLEGYRRTEILQVEHGTGQTRATSSADTWPAISASTPSSERCRP